VQLTRLPESAPVTMTVFPTIRFWVVALAVVHLKYNFRAFRERQEYTQKNNINNSDHNNNNNNNDTLGLKTKFRQRTFIA
jgi:hypothetical protein